MSTPLVQSVMRAFGVLDELTAANACEAGVSLSELARRCGLRPNTLHNLLRSMIAAGYAEAAGGGRYREGLKCRHMGLRNHSSQWAELLQPQIDEWVEQTGESIVFYVLAGVERLMVYHRACAHPVRVIEPVEPHRHFFSLATSRVLAAWSGAETRAALVQRWGLPDRAFDSIRSQAALDRALDAIRAAGMARCLSHAEHVVNLAVPVLVHDRGLLGALGCYLPTSRCTEERERTLLSALKLTSVCLANTLAQAGA